MFGILGLIMIIFVVAPWILFFVLSVKEGALKPGEKVYFQDPKNLTPKDKEK